MFKFDLQPGEKVLNIYRQTESLLFKPVIIVFILIYFPWYFLLKYDLAVTYVRLLIFWTVLVFIYAVASYLIWLLNVYIVTSSRAIVICYQNLFNKKVTESPLNKIQNVSFSIKGFWQTLLRFGNVEIVTAGLTEPLSFKNIIEPSKVKDFIWSCHSNVK